MKHHLLHCIINYLNLIGLWDGASVLLAHVFHTWGFAKFVARRILENQKLLINLCMRVGLSSLYLFVSG